MQGRAVETRHEVNDLIVCLEVFTKKLEGFLKLPVSSFSHPYQAYPQLLDELGDLKSEGEHQLNWLKALSTRDFSIVIERLEYILETVTTLSEEVSKKDKQRSLTLFRELLCAYESYRYHLSVQLGYAVSQPLRLTNAGRSIFHMGWGVFAVCLAEFCFELGQLWWIAFSFCSFAWTLELMRRAPRKLGGTVAQRIYRLAFGKIAHPHELYSITSGTWYVTAVLLLSSTVSKVTLILAVLTLAIGDPFAGLVGRRFGSLKLIGQRTVEGSLGFFVSAGLANVLLLSLLHPLTSHPWLIAFAAAAGGSLGELISGRILDDNFTIPIGAALGIFALHQFGI